jgi:hypothetical protein
MFARAALGAAILINNPVCVGAAVTDVKTGCFRHIAFEKETVRTALRLAGSLIGDAPTENNRGCAGHHSGVDLLSGQSFLGVEACPPRIRQKDREPEPAK